MASLFLTNKELSRRNQVFAQLQTIEEMSNNFYSAQAVLIT